MGGLATPPRCAHASSLLFPALPSLRSRPAHVHSRLASRLTRLSLAVNCIAQRENGANEKHRIVAPRYSKAARRFYNETCRAESERLSKTPVNPLKDAIFLDGRSLLKKAPPKFYFALHKPKGYICSSAKDAPKPALSLLGSLG